MTRRACFWLLVLAGCIGTPAHAQTIEISSPSIGTVIVTPPPINGTGGTATPASNRGRSGVDFGIKRRADGSLYDPLDPAQNPAAAPAITTSAAPNANASAANSQGGAGNVESNAGAAVGGR